MELPPRPHPKPEVGRRKEPASSDAAAPSGTVCFRAERVHAICLPPTTRHYRRSRVHNAPPPARPTNPHTHLGLLAHSPTHPPRQPVPAPPPLAPPPRPPPHHVGVPSSCAADKHLPPVLVATRGWTRWQGKGLGRNRPKPSRADGYLVPSGKKRMGRVRGAGLGYEGTGMGTVTQDGDTGITSALPHTTVRHTPPALPPCNLSDPGVQARRGWARGRPATQHPRTCADAAAGPKTRTSPHGRNHARGSRAQCAAAYSVHYTRLGRQPPPPPAHRLPGPPSPPGGTCLCVQVEHGAPLQQLRPDLEGACWVARVGAAGAMPGNAPRSIHAEETTRAAGWLRRWLSVVGVDVQVCVCACARVCMCARVRVHVCMGVRPDL